MRVVFFTTKFSILFSYVLLFLIYFAVVDYTYLLKFYAYFLFMCIIISLFIILAPKTSLYLKSCYIMAIVLIFVLYQFTLYLINSGINKYNIPINLTNDLVFDKIQPLLNKNNVDICNLTELEIIEFIPKNHVTDIQYISFYLYDHVTQIISSIIFGLLILFNIHYIISIHKYHLPALNNHLKIIYNKSIDLDYGNLIIIILVILLPIFLVHFSLNVETIFKFYEEYFGQDAIYQVNFIKFFMLNYFLTLFFLLTLSVHFWLNFSITHTFYKTLIHENCIDLRTRNKYKLLRDLTSYLSLTSYRYFILLSLSIISYISLLNKIPNDGISIHFILSGFLKIEPFVLSIFFLIFITINLILFLHIFIMSRDFLYTRYSKINDFNSYDDIIMSKSIIEPFSPRNNVMIFISEFTSIIYIMTPIIKIFFSYEQLDNLFGNAVNSTISEMILITIIIY